MRTVRRSRHYLAKHWLTLLTPAFGYNDYRDAYVLRGIGKRFGPVLRLERRARGEVDRGVWREQRFEALQPGESFDRRRRGRASIA